MTFEEFLALGPEAQRQTLQKMWGPPEHPIFRGIKQAFLEAYPECAQNSEPHVGAAGGLGHLNAITIVTQPGSRLRLPRDFMGLPVIRRTRRPNGQR